MLESIETYLITDNDRQTELGSIIVSEEKDSADIDIVVVMGNAHIRDCVSKGKNSGARTSSMIASMVANLIATGKESYEPLGSRLFECAARYICTENDRPKVSFVNMLRAEGFQVFEQFSFIEYSVVK